MAILSCYTVIKNNVLLKEFDMQQERNEIALPKELSNEQFKASDKILQDDLNISNKVNYDIFYESRNLPLTLKCIEQKVEFQQGKKEFDTDCNKKITTNEEWKNIYDKLQRELQEINSASSQKVTKEEEVNKDMSEKFEHNIARISTVTQLNIEENGATLSRRSVKNIKSLHEQLKEKNKEELKNIKSTQPQVTTNVKPADLKMINISSKIDSIVKTELMRQNAYLRFISAKYQDEIKRLRAQLQMYYNRCNMPDEKITPRTDFVMQKTNTMNKILELESEVLKLKVENQQYMERIEKFCCNEEDICMNRREYEDENSKNQKIKHEKYESNMQIKLMNRILMLYTEIKWWKQRFQRNRTALITMMTEKQKAELELMKFITKITQLRNLRNTLETEELNLLFQKKNKIKKTWKESCNALQNSILRKESQQMLSEMNSVSSNMQNTLKDQVSEIVAKDSDKDYITLPSVTRRQVVIKEGDYNYITLSTTKIADTKSDKTVKTLKQVDKDFNKDTLIKLLTDFEDKINNISNKNFVKIMESLKDRKTNDKSTIVEENISTFAKDFNKDCTTSPSRMRQIEEEDYDIMPLPTNIVDKESDKAVESPKQVDKDSNKDSLIEPLTDFEDTTNEIQNKEIIKVTELLENLKTSDELTVVEEQVPTLAEDFNKYCVTLPSIMQQIEEDYDYNITPSPTNIVDKELDKAVESSKQVDKDSNKDSLTKLTDFEDEMNNILKKGVVKIMELLENLKTSDESTVVEEQVPTLAEDFNKYCVTLPSIMQQIEEDYDFDITPSPTNIADKELDKAVESSKQVEKDSNKDSLTESLTDFEDTTNEIQNKEIIKVTELLGNLKTSDELTVVEEQVPTLAEDFDEDCVRAPSIIRQMEVEDYDYDIVSSPTNIADKELDKAVESSKQVDKDSNKDTLTEPLTDFEDTTNEIQNKKIIKVTELLENLKTSDESTVVEEQVPTLAEDFDEDCVRSPSIIREIEEEDYDYDIAPSPTNIADKGLDKAVESPIEVDKDSNKDALTEPSTDFEDTTNEIQNKEIMKVTELLENLKTSDESTIVEEQVPTLAEDFDEDCVRSASIIRQIELEDYDYDITPSPTNIVDKESDEALESPKQVDKNYNKDSLTKLTYFKDKMNNIFKKNFVKIMELLEDLKTSDDESTVVEEQVPTLTEDFNKNCVTLPSIIQQIKVEDYDFDITPSPTNITDKELDKAVESSKQVDKDSNKDALTEPLTDFEDKTNEIRNKETVKVTELLENLKTSDKSTDVEEQVQNKDQVADSKKEAKRDDKIFKENLTFSLPFYESLLSSITKNQSIVKNMMDRVYQNQPADDYESFENCSFCKKLNEHTSQQGEKNQLGPNEIDANVNNNHIKCNYCNLAINILMTKYDNTIGHVNNEFQTIENNKNREHEHMSSEAVEEDQTIKVVEENKIDEVKNTYSNTTSNETLPYAKDLDVTFENNIEALAKYKTFIIEDAISNVAPKKLIIN